jgi:Pseudouridylate synthases, 23S RNA-specific
MRAMAVNFDVLGETEDLLAIDKPAGLLVHPTRPGGPPTLWDGLRDLLAYEVVNGGQVSLINRLDRETSGVVLIAKNAAAARACGIAMQAGRVRKEYLAIVHGWPEWDECEINAPIVRLGEVAESRVHLKRAVHPAGAESRTRFRVESRVQRADGERLARVRAFPLTGRTHQIRVHLAHAGHPVVGDKLYGPDEALYLEFIETGWTESLAERLWLPRHALHSAALELDFRGDSTRWEAAMPRDMAELLE